MFELLRFKHSISHVKKERSNRKDVYRRTDRYAISDQYTNNGESEKKRENKDSNGNNASAQTKSHICPRRPHTSHSAVSEVLFNMKGIRETEIKDCVSES